MQGGKWLIIGEMRPIPAHPRKSRTYVGSGIAAFLIAAVIAAPAWGQSPQLRSWPISGDWLVALVRARSLGGKPACLMMTGYKTAGSPDYRIWGIRTGGDELTLITNSKGQEDVAGSEMEVSVDGYVIGRFRVTDRPPGGDGVMTAVASVLDASSVRRLVGLLHAGSAIRIANGPAVYEAMLDQVAAANFDQCREEADLLAQ